MPNRFVKAFSLKCWSEMNLGPNKSSRLVLKVLVSVYDSSRGAPRPPQTPSPILGMLRRPEGGLAPLWTPPLDMREHEIQRISCERMSQRGMYERLRGRQSPIGGSISLEGASTRCITVLLYYLLLHSLCLSRERMKEQVVQQYSDTVIL